METITANDTAENQGYGSVTGTGRRIADKVMRMTAVACITMLPAGCLTVEPQGLAGPSASEAKYDAIKTEWFRVATAYRNAYDLAIAEDRYLAFDRTTTMPTTGTGQYRGVAILEVDAASDKSNTYVGLSDLEVGFAAAGAELNGSLSDFMVSQTTRSHRDAWRDDFSWTNSDRYHELFFANMLREPFDVEGKINVTGRGWTNPRLGDVEFAGHLTHHSTSVHIEGRGYSILRGYTGEFLEVGSDEDLATVTITDSITGQNDDTPDFNLRTMGAR